MKRILSQSMWMLVLAVLISACGGGGSSGGGGAGETKLMTINVTPESPSIARGTIQQFTATGVYSNNSSKDITASATWISSEPTVATINNLGLATAIQAGTTLIIATLSDVTSYFAVLTVTAATSAPLTSVAITPINPSIAPGTTQQFAATGIFADSTTLNLTTQVTWNSSNTGVATINSSGLATAVAVGSTTITASSGSISGIATLTVTPAGSLSGSLDHTFGTGGMVVTGVGTAALKSDAAYAMAIQSDGKIVAAGQAFVRSSSGGPYYPDSALVRYNSNGTLDSSFGTGGIVTTPVGTSSSFSALAIQTDGKIVTAGWSWNSGRNSDFALVRYNADGSLDSAFGSSGIVIAEVGSGHSVSIQGDGKILVSGTSWNDSTDYDFTLVRYNADGSLDGTFGTGGKTTTDIRNGHDNGYSMAIQGDGKIVIVGNASRGITPIWDIALARYNADGSVDNTFGTGGKVITVIGSDGGVADAVAIQNDGKILAAGKTILNNRSVIALVRYNADGSLDNTFGTGGIVTTSVGNSDDNANGVVVQSDGKIVVAGSSWNGSNNDFAIVRYNPDGSPDGAFAGGKVTTAVGNGNDIASAVAIQGDGKIVAAGSSSNDFAVVRYWP